MNAGFKAVSRSSFAALAVLSLAACAPSGVSYQALMKGGKFGPLVKPGDALTSTLNILVEGRAHSSIRMPHGREKLPDKDIDTLKAWVNEGAKNN
jgi:hypothetical protein